MRSTSRRQLSVLCAALLATAATACGNGVGGGGDATPEQSGTAGGASESQSAIPDNAGLIAEIEADEALSAGLPPEVAQSKTVNIGSNIQSAPNNFYATDGTTPSATRWISPKPSAPNWVSRWPTRTWPSVR